MATNSLPNVLISQDPCFFEYQYIGDECKYTANSVLDQRVSFHPANKASTYAQIINSLPLLSGLFAVTTSLSSPYNPSQFF